MGKVRPCDIHKLANSFKLKKVCGHDGIPNECFRHFPRRPLVHLPHLFNHCHWLSHFQKPWKEAKVITLPKPSKDPKFPQHLHLISLLPITGKLFKKVTLKIVQRHTEERGLFNTSHFDFCAHYSMTLQCMGLMDHVTLNFNNMSIAAVFLDTGKDIDTTWHLGLLHKLLELKFSISLIKLINSFLSQRKFRVLVEGEISMPKDTQAGVKQASVLSPTLYSLYINDIPQTPGVYLGLLLMTPVHMRQTAKRVMFSESSSEVPVLVRGVSAGK
jgi:hypothetical protein